MSDPNRTGRRPRRRWPLVLFTASAVATLPNEEIGNSKSSSTSSSSSSSSTSKELDSVQQNSNAKPSRSEEPNSLSEIDHAGGSSSLKIKLEEEEKGTMGRTAKMANGKNGDVEKMSIKEEKAIRKQKQKEKEKEEQDKLHQMIRRDGKPSHGASSFVDLASIAPNPYARVHLMYCRGDTFCRESSKKVKVCPSVSKGVLLQLFKEIDSNSYCSRLRLDVFLFLYGI